MKALKTHWNRYSVLPLCLFEFHSLFKNYAFTYSKTEYKYEAITQVVVIWKCYNFCAYLHLDANVVQVLCILVLFNFVILNYRPLWIWNDIFLFCEMFFLNIRPILNKHSNIITSYKFIALITTLLTHNLLLGSIRLTYLLPIAHSDKPKISCR